jgi:hypothetical protein
MAIDKNSGAGHRQLIDHEVASLPGILEKVYAKGDYRRVGLNIDLISRSLLQRGMMSARIEGDFQSARADFALAAGWTREFDRALEALRQSGQKPVAPRWFACLDIQSFEIPLFACLLAHDWPRAQALARITHDPLVLELEDETKTLMTRLLAAFVLDDRAAFAERKAVYDKSKKSAWWAYFVHYVDMYDSVISRDQARYDELAAKADGLYRARAKDRKFGDLRPEYGGQAENERMLDFIALAIAIVAVERGMRPGKQSDIVPAALISPG